MVAPREENMRGPGTREWRSWAVEALCSAQDDSLLAGFPCSEIAVLEPKRFEAIVSDFRSVLGRNPQGLVWDGKTFVSFCVKSNRTSQSLATACSATFAGAKSQRLAA